MATAIHHGPPGSFKSFTLIQRFAIQALSEGRTVVTNVRGFNDLGLVIEQFPEIDFPDSAKILYVDCTSRENRDFMARWFHWVPFGALVIIDEVQQIYPNRRDFRMESLDVFYPFEGLEIEQLPEPRPDDIFTAFEKQRHYNWDIYLSTPHIAKVKSDIRECSEWAYRHRNISGILPWKKDSWMEHQHDPETSGKAATHRVGSPTEYKADPRIYKCYSSTATGEHTENKTGRSVFADAKILSVLGLVGVCLAVFVGLLIFKFSSKNDSSPVKAPVSNGPVKAADPVPDVRPVRSAGPVSSPGDHLVTPADYLNWSYKGVTVDDLPKLPHSCTIFNDHVVCSFPRNAVNIINASRNHFCTDKICNAIFEFKGAPLEPSDSDTMSQTVAKL